MYTKQREHNYKRNLQRKESKWRMRELKGWLYEIFIVNSKSENSSWRFDRWFEIYRPFGSETLNCLCIIYPIVAV